MSRRRWAAVPAAALLVAGCSGESGHRAPRAAPPATAAPSNAAPSTSPPSATPPAAAAPAAAATPALAVFTGAGAFMTPPQAATTKPYGLDPACHDLLDPGFSGTCQQVTTPAGTVAALSEQQDQPGGGESRELLYRRAGDVWTLALRYSGRVTQDSGLLDSSLIADVAADGDHKAVFTLRAPADGTGASTSLVAVDVAEATGQVVLHLSLDHGVARTATGGGVEAWTRIAGSSPLQFRHLVVRYHDGAWRAEVDRTVPADQVPRPDDRSSAAFY